QRAAFGWRALRGPTTPGALRDVPCRAPCGRRAAACAPLPVARRLTALVAAGLDEGPPALGGPGVEDLVSAQPRPAGRQHAETELVEAGRVVRVAVDADHRPQLRGRAGVRVAQVEPLVGGVDLERGAALGRHAGDRLDVDRR